MKAQGKQKVKKSGNFRLNANASSHETKVWSKIDFLRVFVRTVENMCQN